MGRPHRTGIMQRFEHQNWFFDVGHELFAYVMCVFVFVFCTRIYYDILRLSLYVVNNSGANKEVLQNYCKTG